MAYDGKLYIVNVTFDGGTYGEYIETDPTLVADWIEAGWISECDERGERIVRGDTIDGATPVVARTVTAEDQPAPDA